MTPTAANTIDAALEVLAEWIGWHFAEVEVAADRITTLGNIKMREGMRHGGRTFCILTLVDALPGWTAETYYCWEDKDTCEGALQVALRELGQVVAREVERRIFWAATEKDGLI